MKRLAVALLTTLTAASLLLAPPASATGNAPPAWQSQIQVHYCGGSYAYSPTYYTEQDALVAWTNVLRNLWNGSTGYQQVKLQGAQFRYPQYPSFVDYSEADKNNVNCLAASSAAHPAVAFDVSSEASFEFHATKIHLWWEYCSGDSWYDTTGTPDNTYSLEAWGLTTFANIVLRQYGGLSGVTDVYWYEDGTASLGWTAYANWPEIHSAAHPPCTFPA